MTDGYTLSDFTHSSTAEVESVGELFEEMP